MRGPRGGFGAVRPFRDAASTPPDWPLSLAAGYVSGFWAFPLTYASIAFASVLAFLAARYLLRDKVRLILTRRRKYRALDRAVADDGAQEGTRPSSTTALPAHTHPLQAAPGRRRSGTQREA